MIQVLQVICSAEYPEVLPIIYLKPHLSRAHSSLQEPRPSLQAAPSQHLHLFNILPQIHLLEHVLRKMIRALTRRFFHCYRDCKWRSRLRPSSSRQTLGETKSHIYIDIYLHLLHLPDAAHLSFPTDIPSPFPPPGRDKL